MVGFLTAGLRGTETLASDLEPADEEKVLTSAGVEPDRDGILRFLRQGGFKAPPPEEIQALIRTLDHDDWEKREEAQRRLRSLGFPAAPALRKVPASAEPEIKKRAAELYRELGPEQEDLFWRVFFDRALRERGAETTGALLDFASRAPPGRGLDFGERALERAAREEDRPLLSRQAAEGTPQARRACLRALGSLPPSNETRKLLTNGTGDKDVRIAEGARLGLTTLRETEKLLEQAEALKSPDARVRAAASLALSEKDDDRVAPWLLAALKDPSPEVRANAASGFSRLLMPAAFPDLVGALRDEDGNVRWNAAEALRKIVRHRGLRFEIGAAAAGAPPPLVTRDAVMALVEELARDNSNYRRVVEDVLRELTGEDFGNDPALWRSWLRSTEEAPADPSRPPQ